MCLFIFIAQDVVGLSDKKQLNVMQTTHVDMYIKTKCWFPLLALVFVTYMRRSLKLNVVFIFRKTPKNEVVFTKQEWRPLNGT